MASDSIPSCVTGNQASQSVKELERARKREIAGYLKAASFPPYINGGPPTSPTRSSDPVLNALVQLGTLRLDCDRAFLSLIDDENQYICAEMTKNQPLSPDSTTDGATLFLGRCKLPMDYGVCPLTMKTFMDTDGSMEQHGPDVVANTSRYIITDFRRTDHYATKPYVTGYPFMVSYLEVPLISPLGYVLGSYCVVDNKRRDFDNDETVSIMSEMSRSIMQHLDSALMNQRLTRAESLISGLSSYSGRGEQPRSGTMMSQHACVNLILPIEASRTARSDNQRSDVVVNRNDSAQSEGAKLTSQSCEMVQNTAVTPRHELDPTPSEDPDRIRSSTATNHESQMASESSQTPETDRDRYKGAHLSLLQEAAKTTREALNLNGLMFLDSVPTKPRGPSDMPSSSSTPSSAASPTSNPRSSTTRGTSAQVLAQSLDVQQSEMFTTNGSGDILVSTLQGLIKRFPYGAVFTADQYGPIAESFAPGVKVDLKQASASNAALSDEIELFQCLTQARYILFVPLWHFQRECWFTAMVGWTTDATQAMDTTDVNLLAAFGSSVISKIAFAEASAMSTIKSDFISSISHELRSPLHAIMATSELLREQLIDESTLAMVDMIDSCGTTLLDTFSNLLDHAKINKSSALGDAFQPEKPDSQPLATGKDYSYILNLGHLVEDIVAIVTLGHDASSAMQRAPVRRSSSTDGSRLEESTYDACPVQVVVDNTSALGYEIKTDSAAWKRIVMNLTGNALKYTEEGIVEIVISIVATHTKDNKVGHQILLEINDTGIGMSPEYLRYHLFQSFSQENAMAPGTGLGLSIVQQLVHDLGGEIYVDSQRSVGTSIKVVVPVTESMDLKQIDRSVEVKSASYRSAHGRTICILTSHLDSSAVESPAHSIEQRRKSVLHKRASNIAQHIGMIVLFRRGSSVPPPADFYFFDSNNVQDVLDSSFTKSPIIIPYAAVIPEASRTPLASSPIITLGNLISPSSLRRSVSKFEASVSSTTAGSSPLHDSSGGSHRPTPHVKQAFIDPTPLLGNYQYESPSKETFTTGLLHVLLVDDNAINLKLLIKLMDKFNHTFETAMDGSQAVELFNKSLGPTGKAFDVVFMDLSMPVMDGFEATRRIRHAEEVAGSSPCEIHALTGLGSEGAQLDALHAGFSKFLKKPVKMKDIADILATTKR